MTTALSARMKSAIRHGEKLALLAYIDHPNGEVRVWSHTGTLRYDGHDWQGVSILGRVSPGSQSSSLAIRQVEFSLSGVPPVSTQFLSSRVRNRAARVWLAALKGRRVIPDPVLIIDALLDYQTLKVDDNGLATITLTGNAGFWLIERATNQAWTHEDQIARYPNDSGLSLLHEMKSKESTWRLS